MNAHHTLVAYHPRRIAKALTVTGFAILSACAPDATPTALPLVTPADPPSTAIWRAEKSNPNVSRVDQPFTFGVLDEEADLYVVVGLPLDLSTVRRCGGPDRAAVTTYQYAAQLTQALKILVRNPQLPIHVYRWSQFIADFGGDVCTAPDIARGIGRGTYADNDGYASGTRTNTFGLQATGLLDDLTSGGKVHLDARAHFLVYQDGSYEIRSTVHLKPLGH